MANRPRDIEDCAALASAKMHFEAIYSEIEAQYARAGTVEEKIRITYMEEGIGKLEEDYRMQLAVEYRSDRLLVPGDACRRGTAFGLGACENETRQQKSCAP